jgi:hypothetical protein
MGQPAWWNGRTTIDAGLARLLSESTKMLRSALNASTLSPDMDMSTDTASRLFKDGPGSSADAIVYSASTG